MWRRKLECLALLESEGEVRQRVRDGVLDLGVAQAVAWSGGVQQSRGMAAAAERPVALAAQATALLRNGGNDMLAASERLLTRMTAMLAAITSIVRAAHSRGVIVEVSPDGEEQGNGGGSDSGRSAAAPDNSTATAAPTAAQVAAAIRDIQAVECRGMDLHSNAQLVKMEEGVEAWAACMCEGLHAELVDTCSGGSSSVELVAEDVVVAREHGNMKSVAS
ncbi:hypothetical protein JKP88DRAFT_276037 [Tribonema minus]|uniref:Uncharacterized protein n=1 Tax=Tribonema minus TaxID=303371 RepID=A0A835Z4S8_9STRA|nr:hypothetical protein JKP88DRAFT_276037 [Tribonema minus]